MFTSSERTALLRGEPSNWVPQRGDMRIISNGLKAGERVIVKGLAASSPWAKS